jgi:hypothetical protein
MPLATSPCDAEGERDDTRRHSKAQRVLLGRVLDEVERMGPERSGPSRLRLARSANVLPFEQIFGANEQVPHVGGCD